MKTHGVYFYEDDTFLVDKVAQFVKNGLERQETVIVIATAEHRTDLETKLMADNLIGLSASTGGHYLTLDASATLSLFTLNGWPDGRLFLKVMGQFIGSAPPGTGIRIYGEIVGALWAEGKYRAAIRLEELWNKFALHHDFSLLCGYPSLAFQDPDHALALEDVCACHGEITGSPRWSLRDS
jgi:MEDS: MEthanogen/methylotroph, DcmR Sensory domain